MAIQTVFLTENTTAYATDVMNLVDPLYTDLDGSNVSDKTGTGTTLVLSDSPTFTGAVTAASIIASGNLTVGGTISGGPFTGNLAVTGNLSATGTFAVNGDMTFGDASGDTITINAATGSIPNNLNIGTNLFYLNNADQQICIGETAPMLIDVTGLYRVNIKALGSNRCALNLESDASGSSGVLQKLYTNSSSPANNDLIGSIHFDGNNSNGALNPVDYFKLRAYIKDVTAGAEQGGFELRTIQAGVDTAQFSFDASISTLDCKNNIFINVSGLEVSSTSKFRVENYSTSTTYTNGIKFGLDSVSSAIGATNVNYTSVINNRADLTLVSVNNGANEQITFSSRNSYFAPTTDNSLSCGRSGGRWAEVWAAIGAINTSDKREKKNIKDCDLGLDFINALRPVSYKWKKGKRKETFYGLIAQEVEEVLAGKDFAGLVKPEEEGHLYGLRDKEFHAPMIKAIQQLSKKINDLEKILG